VQPFLELEPTPGRVLENLVIRHRAMVAPGCDAMSLFEELVLHVADETDHLTSVEARDLYAELGTYFLDASAEEPETREDT
jgi:hypothetical protein